jgi:hypothetical protein
VTPEGEKEYLMVEDEDVLGIFIKEDDKKSKN